MHRKRQKEKNENVSGLLALGLTPASAAQGSQEGSGALGLEAGSRPDSCCLRQASVVPKTSQESLLTTSRAAAHQALDYKGFLQCHRSVLLIGAVFD